jgi:4-hydroxy-2-oxoheptanedioate aldolase
MVTGSISSNATEGGGQMRPRINTTKRTLNSGGTVFGVFVGIPSPRVVELCGIAGFDYVVIDAEHGPIDLGVCEDMVRAAEAVGMTPVVRVPSHDPKVILRYLDVGAQGIMAPQVNSLRDARAIIDATKYAPIGNRGLGPGRSAMYGLGEPLREYAPNENSEMLVIVQLENIAAADELDALVKIPEIDAFEIGTADLSASMGYPGQSDRDDVQEVVRRFEAAVLGANRVIGDTANDAQAARDLWDRGYRMLDCGFESYSVGVLKGLVASVRDAVNVHAAV